MTQALEAPTYSAAVSEILDVLGLPETEEQHKSLQAFAAKDYATVKTLAAVNLDNYFCKALAYLASAMNPAAAANLGTILGEAARSAADHVASRERKAAIARMQRANAITLS